MTNNNPPVIKPTDNLSYVCNFCGSVQRVRSLKLPKGWIEIPMPEGEETKHKCNNCQIKFNRNT